MTADRGYGFAYFHWHTVAWAATSGRPFYASDCLSCYNGFANIQRIAKLQGRLT